ncbi:MAG: lauroyl acyltransferase, partial [Proteobacteria bacterium]|nr:lauroyl acyltransferase [Pseudomonadota bacterium]
MPKLPPPINRYLFHPLEAAAAMMAYSLMRVLPIDMASALGGWLGRTVGPHIPVSARAVKNLSAAFP